MPSVGRELPAVTPNPVAFAHQVGEMLAARLVLGDDPVVVRARATAAARLGREALERHGHAGHHAALGHGDPCLANYLWDGNRIRLIDFEDCGPSDRAFELAILTAHISAWSDARLDADDLLAMFDLTRTEQTRVQYFRRLAALFWLIMLRPGSFDVSPEDLRPLAPIDGTRSNQLSVVESTCFPVTARDVGWLHSTASIAENLALNSRTAVMQYRRSST